MSDSFNSFQSLLPEMKDSYASKIQKLSEKPNSSKQYFNHIKKYLKKAKKRK